MDVAVSIDHLSIQSCHALSDSTFFISSFIFSSFFIWYLRDSISIGVSTFFVESNWVDSDNQFLPAREYTILPINTRAVKARVIRAMRIRSS